MILIQEAIDKYGYHPDKLSKGARYAEANILKPFKLGHIEETQVA